MTTTFDRTSVTPSTSRATAWSASSISCSRVSPENRHDRPIGHDLEFDVPGAGIHSELRRDPARQREILHGLRDSVSL